MKRAVQASVVMKSASKAASRTGRWSPAKQDFAQRVTASGSFAQKTAASAVGSKSGAAARQGPHK
jgi:hypothetical protein